MVIIVLQKLVNDYLMVFLPVFLSSRHAEKYVRKGRLDWPDGATSRESIKAAMKLPRLQVCTNNLIKYLVK
jgi:hypothetical protein